MPLPGLLHSSVGDYRLVELLGAGGMGEVYRAVHRKIGREAAVKVLTAAAGDPASLERFRNEARLQATLHHPNIATLYDFLELDGRPCIVMEYVDGETLADAIRRRGPVPPDAAWEIFRHVAAAVAYVHEQGIVHRDLKSGNIRVSSSGVVKLLDFGIAKSEWTPNLTRTGGLVGTLQYLAPEQLNGERASARSDVWALGIVLYEMLTGRVPFDADTIGQLLERIRTASYAKPSSLCAGAGIGERSLLARADRVVARCLRRAPLDRYPSAREIVEEIEAGDIAPGKDHLAAPAGGATPASRPIGAALAVLERYWAALCASALVVALLTVWLTVRGPEVAPAPGPAPAAAGRASPPPVAAVEDAGFSVHRVDVAEGSADVYVNGVMIGRTPLDYRARRNETVTLELKQHGFASYRDTFDITKKSAWTLVMTHDGGRD